VKTSVAWSPQPGSSVLFLTCPIEECLYSSGRGVGKTDSLLMDFARDVGKGLGAAWRGIIFRQSFPALADVIAKSKFWFPQIWGDKCRYNEGKYQWNWDTGEELMFRALESERDYGKYHGWSVPWLGFEELTNWATPYAYQKMFSINRSSDKRVQRRIRATTNPYGPGRNWVSRRFQLDVPTEEWNCRVLRDNVDDEGNPLPDRVAIHGRLEENKILLEADPEYINKIRAAASNPAELAAWLRGDWSITAGGMFDDIWERRIHVVPNFVVPPHWRIDRAFDWGSGKPFAVGWFAEATGEDLLLPDGRYRSTVRGDIFQIAEWYGWNGKPDEGCRITNVEIGQGIAQREFDMGILGRCCPGPADNMIFNPQDKSGKSIALEMAAPVRLSTGQIVRGPNFNRT
jgi:hypothetical protein